MGRQEAVEDKVPRMRSCRVGKLSVLGLCLEALVNTISSGRCMILTVHNRELVLLRYQVKRLCLLYLIELYLSLNGVTRVKVK